MINILKKELVYTVPYTTDEEMRQADQLKSELYDKFNTVNVYINGLHEVKIVAEDEITN